MDRNEISNWIRSSDLSHADAEMGFSSFQTAGQPSSTPKKPVTRGLSSPEIERYLVGGDDSAHFAESSPGLTRNLPNEFKKNSLSETGLKAQTSAPSSQLAQRDSHSLHAHAAQNPNLKKTLENLKAMDQLRSSSLTLRFEDAPRHFSQIFELVERIRAELKSHVHQLVQLNPTRRSALVDHLERLSGQTMAMSATDRNSPTGTAKPPVSSLNVDQKLKAWVTGPLSPLQEAAFEAYLEEIALLSIGQAIVLKAWSNQGIRKWYPKCLAQMNWELSSALKAHVPYGREGWQITSRTIYSWYNPSPDLQRDLWHALELMPESTEWTDELLNALLCQGRKKHTSLPTYKDLTGYNGHFASAIWPALKTLGFSAEAADRAFPLRSRKKVFTPTIREGQLVKCAPENLEWIGLEMNPFLLLIAELTLLCERPSAPPLWTFGTGLESHSREQMSLRLGQTVAPGQWLAPKLTLHSLIGDTESCDLAFVLEDRVVRSNGRNLDAQRLREQVEEFQHFKRVRSPGTSLGDLQACVSLSKLRPEGLLVWARDEALSEQDGREALTYLLERGKLIAEFNFASLQVRIPNESKSLPRFLYIWKRETDIQGRHNHRPLRLSAQGFVSSAEDLQGLLEDAASLTQGLPLSSHRVQRSWQMHSQLSPSTQKEWSEHWPEPTSPEQLLEIARLRAVSLPLAQISTVRAAHSSLPVSSLPSPALRSLSDSSRTTSGALGFTGLLLRSMIVEGQRTLKAEPIPQFKANSAPQENPALQGAFHLFIPADETSLAPLVAWLESPIVRRWVDHLAERKGDRWLLTEQIVKYIPVPRQLLRTLGFSSDPRATAASYLPSLLSAEWEEACKALMTEPKKVLEKFRNEAARKNPQSLEITELRTQLFVRASQTLARLKVLQKQMGTVVNEDGEVRWSELLKILPKSEFTSVSHHSSVRLSGTLPLQTTILRWEKVRTPSLGILLSSEAGHHLHIGCESSRQVDIIWDQLRELKHPTWSELVPWLKLPRDLTRVEQIASDFIQNWHEQRSRALELRELLDESLSFWVAPTQR